MTPPFRGKDAEWHVAAAAPAPAGPPPAAGAEVSAGPAPLQARLVTRSGYRATKRLLDVSASLLLLLLLLPAFAAIAIAVRLTSPGPALYRQTRVGRLGQPFVLLKFRSMRADSDDATHRAYVTALMTAEVAPHGGEAGVYKLTDDPRVTAVGRLLRRTSLDELPQLVNVLQGHMSLVGPRPALPWEVALYDDEQWHRLEVSPGLTGLWQVSGRNRLTMRQSFDLDLEYVARCSTGLDLRILLRTPSAVLRLDSAR